MCGNDRGGLVGDAPQLLMYGPKNFCLNFCVAGLHKNGSGAGLVGDAPGAEAGGGRGAEHLAARRDVCPQHLRGWRRAGIILYLYFTYYIHDIYIYITYKRGKERASRSTARRAPTAPARVTQGGYYIIFILHITFMIYKSFAGDAAYISICIPTHAYTSCFIYIDIYMYIHTYIHI